MGRSRRRRKRILIILLGLVIVFMCLGTYAVDRIFRPVLVAIARNRVQGLGVMMITEVILEEAVEPFHYSDLIHVETTQEGYVSYMMPNTVRISRIVARVGQGIQEKVNALGDEPLGIPLGQLTGMSILANTGPDLPVRILPVGTAQVAVEEDFVGVGINHAKHTIFLTAGCTLIIAVPLVREDMEVSVRLPIAEAIIVGPVPQQYLQFNWGR